MHRSRGCLVYAEAERRLDEEGGSFLPVTVCRVVPVALIGVRQTPCAMGQICPRAGQRRSAYP